MERVVERVVEQVAERVVEQVVERGLERPRPSLSQGARAGSVPTPNLVRSGPARATLPTCTSDSSTGS